MSLKVGPHAISLAKKSVEGVGYQKDMAQVGPTKQHCSALVSEDTPWHRRMKRMGGKASLLQKR